MGGGARCFTRHGVQALHCQGALADLTPSGAKGPHILRDGAGQWGFPYGLGRNEARASRTSLSSRGE